MQNEYEIKFININEVEIREKLLVAGATHVGKKKLMRRQTLDFPKGTIPEGQKKWARVRDEGNKISMTIKHIVDKTRIDGTKEVEVKVHSFDSACEIFVQAGLSKTSYQENYREEWKLDETMITIDTWPGLQPFIEIESPTKEEAEKIATMLGFNIEEGQFGSIDFLYQEEYKIDPKILNNLPEITFGNFKEVLK